MEVQCYFQLKSNIGQLLMREHFCPYTIQRSTRKSDEIVLYTHRIPSTDDFRKKSKGNAKSEFCRHINNFVTNFFKSVQHFRCIRCGKERTILAKYVVYNILHTLPSTKNKKVLHIYYQIKRNLTTILKKY